MTAALAVPADRCDRESRLGSARRNSHEWHRFGRIYLVGWGVVCLPLET